MKVAILGATRGMGRALAREMAMRGDLVAVLGRRQQDIEASAADLGLRAGGPPAASAVCDLLDPATFGPAMDRAERELGGLDAVVVTAAVFATQEALEQDLALTEQLLTTNFANTILFCEHARHHLLARGGGTLCVFSSVAGERGRKPVVIYGASKAGLSAYLEGLDHKFRSQGLVTVCVKPGFVKTAMTDGLDPPPFAGEPQQVAKQVVRAIDRGKPVVYTPTAWALVMLIIRNLPRLVMRRISF